MTMAVLLAVWAAAAVTVEIKGRVTNQFPEEKYRAVEIVVTDRLGVELGRTHPDRRGQYVVKITGPRYIILKALLDGYPAALYQLDTEEIKESTADREENKAFGELRIPTYFQNVTFAFGEGPFGLDDLLAGENPAAVRAYRSARAHKEAGDVRKAVSSLEKLVREHPDFYIGYIELGMTLAARQESDRALEVFTRAQVLRPQHAWAYVGLGMVLNSKRDYKAAAQHLEKAVALDPNSVQAQFQLGQAFLQLGDHDRARARFHRVIELEPKFSPIAFKYLSSIEVKMGNLEGAARLLESYLANFPDAPDRDKVEQILRKLGR